MTEKTTTYSNAAINNKVIVHGGHGPESKMIELDLVNRLTEVASNCLEFIPIEQYEGPPPYAIVWRQDGRMKDWFELMQDTNIRRIVLHDPEILELPSQYAHVSVTYPSERAVGEILRALSWYPGRQKRCPGRHDTDQETTY
ncbi:TPA: hypothetical protein HA265_03990 [Candidatus Woesearchaeota archaeon]|nr:hypothetical protein [Candidatus Woesearchaeota archaeon]